MDEYTEWFERERGITADTLQSFGLRFQDGCVIYKYPDGLEKRRYGLLTGERRFSWETGTVPRLYNPPQRKQTVILTEGETDCMRLWQELQSAGHSEIEVCALPGIETWNEKMADMLRGSTKLFVVLDNDPDYAVRVRVDSVWRSIRRDIGPECKRVFLPDDVKDICEFFERYNLDALRELLRSKNAHTGNLKGLDLSKRPEPYEWLVEGLLCQGDVVIVVGEPSAGKSWLSMSLAVSLAEKKDYWLGHKLNAKGRVLYIDEENPEDVVLHRLWKLGLRNGKNQIKYVHNQGLRIDKNPEVLLDEAFAYEPQLIVLDSLTRFHTGDENSSGFINKLFGDSIKPLARETGATVVVLHHTSKSDSNSSFIRSRGSGDISATVDCAIDVRLIKEEKIMYVTPYKNRRAADGNTLELQIKDKPDGSVEVEPVEGIF